METSIEALRQKITVLSESIAKSKSEIVALNRQIATLNGNEEFPWRELAIEYITSRGEGASVTTDEILTWIFCDRPEYLKEPMQRRKYMTGLSVALHQLCKRKKLKNHKTKGERGLRYSLPPRTKN